MSIKIGDEFYKTTSETEYLTHCTKCGRERQGTDPKYASFGDDYCANCGRSYWQLKQVKVTVYVIGIGENFKGERTLQLCELPPERLLKEDETSYSYWNTTVDKLGKEFFEEKPA